MLEYLVPGLLAFICLVALRKKEDPYSLLLEGGADGLKLLATLVPTLVMLMTAISILRASGLTEAISTLLAPVMGLFGIPPECAMLLLIRPISGSAALAVGAELMTVYGTDSLIGRTAAVMLGSTETTFYTISVYFGACGIRRSRYTVPAALFADLVGFTAASFTARWL